MSSFEKLKKETAYVVVSWEACGAAVFLGISGAEYADRANQKISELIYEEMDSISRASDLGLFDEELARTVDPEDSSISEILGTLKTTYCGSNYYYNINNTFGDYHSENMSCSVRDLIFAAIEEDPEYAETVRDGYRRSIKRDLARQ